MGGKDKIEHKLEQLALALKNDTVKDWDSLLLYVAGTRLAKTFKVGYETFDANIQNDLGDFKFNHAYRLAELLDIDPEITIQFFIKTIALQKKRQSKNALNHD